MNPVNSDLNALVPVESSDIAIPAPPEVPEEWGLGSSRRQESLAKVRHAVGDIKHGIFSTIPMICKNEACPYKNQCMPQQRGEVVTGERCILEIGKIMEWSKRYCAEFNLDPTDPEQRTDMVLVQQIVTNEIILERCQMALAAGNLIEEVEVAMNPQGDVITQPMVHKAAELLPKIQRRQNELLNLMVATRKDKLATTGGSGMSVADVFKKMIENAAQSEARLKMMREGDHAGAEALGFKYGIDAHMDAIELEG